MNLFSKVFVMVSTLIATSFPAFSHVGDHGTDVYQALLHFISTPVHLVAFIMIGLGVFVAIIAWFRAVKKG